MKPDKYLIADTFPLSLPMRERGLKQTRESEYNLSTNLTERLIFLSLKKIRNESEITHPLKNWGHTTFQLWRVLEMGKLFKTGS